MCRVDFYFSRVCECVQISIQNEQNPTHWISFCVIWFMIWWRYILCAVLHKLMKITNFPKRHIFDRVISYIYLFGFFFASSMKMSIYRPIRANKFQLELYNVVVRFFFDIPATAPHSLPIFARFLLFQQFTNLHDTYDSFLPCAQTKNSLYRSPTTVQIKHTFDKKTHSSAQNLMHKNNNYNKEKKGIEDNEKKNIPFITLIFRWSFILSVHD